MHHSRCAKPPARAPTHPGARRLGRRVSLPRHLWLLRWCGTRVEERRDPFGLGLGLGLGLESGLGLALGLGLGLGLVLGLGFWAVQSRAGAALGPAVPSWCHQCSEAPPKVAVSPHVLTGVAGAILAWIADIVACDELQQLPLGLPYPQLHAFGWHLGT